MDFSLAFKLLLLFFNLLPALLKAATETLEAFQLSGTDASAADKIRAAVDAGVACYDVADKQFDLPPAMDQVMRDQFIPALVAMLFYGAGGQA